MTLLGCHSIRKRGEDKFKKQENEDVQPQLLRMNLGVFLAKRVSILAHNSNITTENFILEISKCFGFFSKNQTWVKEAPAFHLPKKGKTVGTPSSYIELASTPLADQNLARCMETNGAFKPREHLVYNIFFLLFHGCAPGSTFGSTSAGVHVCLFLFILNINCFLKGHYSWTDERALSFLEVWFKTWSWHWVPYWTKAKCGKSVLQILRESWLESYG